MKVRVTILTFVCLLVVSAPVLCQPDIFSAVPENAFGFVATKNLQSSFDSMRLFLTAIGMPANELPNQDALMTVKEKLGDVDLNGPAAIILLNPDGFNDPFVLLLSAANPQAILEAHKAKAAKSAEDLPPGVVPGPDGYLGVKNGLLVFTPHPGHVTEVLQAAASQQVTPAAKAAFEKGQIVLAGDFQKAGPYINGKLDELRTEMMNAREKAPENMKSQMNMSIDMVALYLDFFQSLIKQADKLTVSLDMNAERAMLTKTVLFKADSPAAAFMNLQMTQPVPALTGLPAGAFLVAGGINVAPQNAAVLTEAILDKIASMPSLQANANAEHLRKATAEMKDLYLQTSGMAFTFGLGNMATGLFSGVARYDVADAEKIKNLFSKSYGPDGGATIWAKASGMPVNYVYTKAAESHGDIPVDTVQMQPEGDPRANPMLAQQMQMMTMMFGPNMTIRMAAPNNKMVLLTIGGGSERMDQAIDAVNGTSNSLANKDAVKQAAAALPEKRFAQGYLDVSQVLPMIGMMMVLSGGGATPPPPPAQVVPISMGLSAEENSMRADLVVPSASIKAVVDAFGQMQQTPAAEKPSDKSDKFEWQEDSESDQIEENSGE